MANSSSSAADATRYCATLDDVREAARRVQGLVHRTPVLTSSSLERELVGVRREKNTTAVRLFFKAEALQRTGSFKFRGALNATLALLDERRRNNTKDDDDDDGVLRLVTHSSGNHAQAVALAARIASSVATSAGRGEVVATIVMPRNAPDVKRRAVLSYGATVVDVANSNEAREERADELLRDTPGARFVHPSEDPRVIAGQGTVALEMVEQVRELVELGVDGGANGQHSSLDVVVIPVGGGGLASGNTIALRGLLGDKVKIVLAEPAKLDDAKRSRDAGVLLRHAPDNDLDSVADGLKTTLGPNTWPVVRDLVDDVFTVDEEQILRATRLVWERLKICVEPSAGVGAAVLLFHDEFRERYLEHVDDSNEKRIVNVGVVLCGGNVDVVATAAKMGALSSPA